MNDPWDPLAVALVVVAVAVWATLLLLALMP